jgi:hypothetical protein
MLFDRLGSIVSEGKLTGAKVLLPAHPLHRFPGLARRILLVEKFDPAPEHGGGIHEGLSSFDRFALSTPISRRAVKLRVPA